MIIIYAKDNCLDSAGSIKCQLCESDDTTEHLFECAALQRLTQDEMKEVNLESVDSMQELKEIATWSDFKN